MLLSIFLLLGVACVRRAAVTRGSTVNTDSIFWHDVCRQISSQGSPAAQCPLTAQHSLIEPCVAQCPQQHTGQHHHAGCEQRAQHLQEGLSCAVLVGQQAGGAVGKVILCSCDCGQHARDWVEYLGLGDVQAGYDDKIPALPN